MLIKPAAHRNAGPFDRHRVVRMEICTCISTAAAREEEGPMERARQTDTTDPAASLRAIVQRGNASLCFSATSGLT